MNRLEGRKGLASGHCLSSQHVGWIKHGTKTNAATKKRIHRTTEQRDYEMRDCFVAKKAFLSMKLTYPQRPRATPQ